MSEIVGCVEQSKRSICHVIVLGHLIVSVGNEEVLGELRKYGLPGKNVSGEKLLKLCSELELVIRNTYFGRKVVSRGRQKRRTGDTKS